MSTEFISLHTRTKDADAVREQIVSVFAAHEFTLTGDVPAADALDGDTDNDGVLNYGVLVGPPARGEGWTGVYVADWQDSGVLALALSTLAPVLEIWTADAALWGCTLFADGAVADRFASDPTRMADTPEEQDLYRSDGQKLGTLLYIPPPADVLRLAQARKTQFAGAGVDALCNALALPFARAFTGYDEFFDDDPEDFAPALGNWPAWRLLSFSHPAEQETLSG